MRTKPKGHSVSLLVVSHLFFFIAALLLIKAFFVLSGDVTAGLLCITGGAGAIWLGIIHVIRRREESLKERERLQAVDALRKSEERFRSLVETSSDLIWEAGADSRYTYMSPRIRDILGYEPDEVIGKKTPFDLMPPDERERLFPLCDKAIQAQQPFPALENVNLHKDGRRIVLETNGVPVFSADGKLTGYRGIDRDITERKKAEEALRESEEGFVALYRNLPVSMTISTLSEGRFIEVNAYFEKFTGYTREETIGRTVIDLNFFSGPEERKRFLNDVFGSSTQQNREFRYRTRNGDERIGLASGIVMQFRKQTAVVMLLSDITDRSRAERELENYQEKLRLLAKELTLVEERERRRIAADIHDHVGQSLAMARLRLGSLRKADMPEEQRQALEGTYELLDQGIQYTRSLMFELSPLVLYELGFVPALEWLAEQMQAQHGLKCTIVVPGTAHIALDDEMESVLFKVVRELLMNVVKHSGASAVTVTVAVAADNGRITVTVEDSGRGFDVKEVQRRLRTGGGFGLFSIRERMSYMKGTVEIVSSQGRGTRVQLAVPLETERRGRI